MITNKQYMAKEATHREYYGQFVDQTVINFVVSSLGATVLNASTDPHLNDIPLHKWDAMCGYTDRMFAREHQEFTGGHMLRLVGRELGKANGNGFCSPADLVCVAKEAARQYKERT